MRIINFIHERPLIHAAIIVVLMIVAVCFGQSPLEAASNVDHSVWWYLGLFLKVAFLVMLMILSLKLIFGKDKEKSIWSVLLPAWGGIVLLILVVDVRNVIEGNVTLSTKIRLISALIIVLSIILRKSQVAEIFDKKNIANRSFIVGSINSFSAVNFTIEDLIKLATRYVSTCNSNVFHCKYYRKFCKDIKSIKNTASEDFVLAIESLFDKYFNDGKFKKIISQLPHNSQLTFFIANMFGTLLSTYPTEKELFTTINTLKETNKRNLTNSEIVELYMEIGTKHGHKMDELTYDQKLSLLKMKNFI